MSNVMSFFTTRRSGHRLDGVSLALLGLTLLVFFRALMCGFISLDDGIYVYDNSHLALGWTPAGLHWALTTFHAGLWIPLTWLSLMLDHMLYGNLAWGYHLTNILLHAVNVVLLDRLLRRITGWQWRAALVAAIFAVHPLRVESVVWVTERKDVLSLLLGLLAMSAYVAYVRDRSWWKYGLTSLLMALSLMAKPMLVTLPALLLVLDFWPLHRWPAGWSEAAWRRRGRLVLEKIPLLALSALACALTVQAQATAKYLESVSGLTLFHRLANAAVAYASYIGMTLWPHRLAVFYPHPMDWPVWKWSLSLVVLLVVTCLAVAARRRWPAMLAGWLWFLGALVPVIGLVQSASQTMADRFTYLPGIGLLLMVVGCLPAHRLDRPQIRRAGVAATVMILIALSACTVHQISYWRDGKTAHRRALDVTPLSWQRCYDHGLRMLREGRDEEAAAMLQLACDRQPTPARQPLETLALTYYRLNRWEASMRCFARLSELLPDDAETQLRTGVLARRLGREAEALPWLQRATMLDPRSVRAWMETGLALEAVRRSDDAAEAFRQVLRLDPRNVEAAGKFTQDPVASQPGGE
ncbi:MAG: tetratricopeptide repeat protein [Phycisphaeraceae bacterium]|nr:tetratricopeptide repeat protein [Phycisphaeraceae bacterium]